MTKSIQRSKFPKSNKSPVAIEEPKVTDIVSWRFSSCDPERWPLLNENTLLPVIIPFLQETEGQLWSYWLTIRKKKCHEVSPDELNKCARDRLDDLRIEAEKILVIHLENTHCLYGYIMNGICYLLWYDQNHGDNTDCVYRSFKKGDKKKHNRK